jgi:hypothetical protein
MKELIKLDASTKTFKANGTTYYVERSISADRYREYLNIEMELGNGMSSVDFFHKVKEAWSIIADTPIQSLSPNHLNKAQNLLYQSMEGIGKIADRDLEVLRICALFINYDDEDRRFYSKDIEERKIKDWREAGIDVNSFFLLASTFSESIQRLYKLSLENFLQEEAGEEI